MFIVYIATCVTSQQAVQLPDHTSLLAQGKRSHVDHVIHGYVYYYIAEPQMFELTQIVIPKIKAEWESLAYCMRYNPEEVSGFKKMPRIVVNAVKTSLLTG